MSATPGAGTFLREFSAAILANLNGFQRRNVDRLRFPDTAPLAKRVARALLEAPASWMNALHLLPRQKAGIADSVERITAHTGEIDKMHARLADDGSRRLLVQLLAYRALGSRRVKLPTNDAAFWQGRETIHRRLLSRARVGSAGMLGYIDEYDLAPLGIEMRLHAHALNIHNTFILEQYAFVRPGCPRIEARAGDIVIDAGACWGDTSLYFADKVGDAGKVFAYEFVLDNLAVLSRNLKMNQRLAPRIEVVPLALWSRAGERLAYSGAGSASRLGPDAASSGDLATTGTVDQLVASGAASRVDFVKMDIEGAEPEALKGAEESIRRFRPRLAICVYHRLEHLWEIAAWIEALGLGYSFHLDHFTIHNEETVLFAVPPDT